MDPVTLAALMGLGGKLVEVGARVIETWLENRGGGVAIAADGSRLELAGGTLISPALGFDRPALGVEPVPFDGLFVPADPWAEAWLQPEQPVLLVIEDLDELSPLDSVVAMLPLGSGFEGALYPSVYRLGAFVFLDDDAQDWDDLDGGAIVDFSVTSGEPPFSLTVPIEAVTEPADVLGLSSDAPELLIQDSGHVSAGYEDRYDAVFETGVSYQIYVEPVNQNADLDLYVFDENENLVVHDDDIDVDALCTVTPRWTGPFTVVVRCASGSTDYSITVAA